MTFEEYLMYYHASNNPHTDDLLPELYADWLTEEVEIETVIELAEKWHEQELGRLAKIPVESPYSLSGIMKMNVQDELDKLTIRKKQ